MILHAIIDSSGTDGTSGISAKLTVVAEDSSDGINFAEFAGSPLIDVPINDENVRAVVDFPHGRFLRFSVQLHPATGTTAIAYANMTMRASIKNA